MAYYQLAEALFNEDARCIFVGLDATRVEDRNDEEMAVCLGYLGLLMELVGTIANARKWVNFTFRGHKSYIRPTEGQQIFLHPR